jgi:chemotaxis protein methyltransferase CheR
MENLSRVMDIHPENYRFLQEQIYSQVGIVLEDNKHYLFESRLAPIVKQLGLASINELCMFLHDDHHMYVGHLVAEAMTTNETYFFRDPAHYEAIRNTLLPRLREDRKASKTMRFWSAAASTGQEPYSLAMLLLKEGYSDWNLQILATDFSSQVLERARSGTYQQIEVNRGLPLDLLVRYFRRTGLEWQLSDAVRRLVRFETIDLRKSMRTLGPFDLVFCRNVMIYFDSQTKWNIMKEIHGTLFRGGWLLLGGAESAIGLDELFERKTMGNMTVYVAR